MKNLIWCEVTCRRCKEVAKHSGWYSPDTVRKLKKETKNWHEDSIYGVLCPDCWEHVNYERRLGIRDK